MTPEEQAKELINKFKNEQPVYESEDDDEFEEQKRYMYFAKRCALICVDEKIELLYKMATYWDLKNGEWYKKELNTLEQVKTEINKIA